MPPAEPERGAEVSQSILAGTYNQTYVDARAEFESRSADAFRARRRRGRRAPHSSARPLASMSITCFTTAARAL